MTQVRCWTLFAVLAIALVGTDGQAATKKKADPKKADANLVWKSYPVADLFAGESAEDADLLIKFVTSAIEPSSWASHNGSGQIVCRLPDKVLSIHQTVAVHAQVARLLKALVMLQSDAERRAEKQACCGSAGAMLGQSVVQAACPAPPAPMCCAPAKSSCKQYGHFVIDNVKVNAMGVSTTIKKIKFMYKGDGIEADVAKCAMTNGESEHKGDLEKLMKQLTELVEEQQEKKAKKETKEETVHTLPPCGCKENEKCDECEKCDKRKTVMQAPHICCPASPCCPAPCPKCDKDVNKSKCEDKSEKKGKCEDKKTDDEVDAIR
jgi:hypothetical protein